MCVCVCVLGLLSHWLLLATVIFGATKVPVEVSSRRMPQTERANAGQHREALGGIPEG